VRYGATRTRSPTAPAPLATPRQLGRQREQVQLDQREPQLSLRGSKLNEFVFQYADFDNHISARSNNPYEAFPNGVTIGQNINTPQSTAQKKYQFRDDFTWHVAGMGGLGHDLKAGLNFINEPRSSSPSTPARAWRSTRT
jgi:hypothetical protein